MTLLENFKKILCLANCVTCTIYLVELGDYLYIYSNFSELLCSFTVKVFNGVFYNGTTILLNSTRGYQLLNLPGFESVLLIVIFTCNIGLRSFFELLKK